MNESEQKIVLALFLVFCGMVALWLICDQVAWR